MSEILVIDTSTDAVAVALGISSNDSVSKVMAQYAQHSENILAAIEELILERDIERRDIRAIGVGVGPGLFTGLRVGIATAHAFAQALNIPIVFLSSLEMVALATSRILNNSGEIFVARDARRHELYWAKFKYEISTVTTSKVDQSLIASFMKRIDPEQLISPTDFVEMVNDSQASIILDDTERYEEFQGFNKTVPSRLVKPSLDLTVMIDHVSDAVKDSKTGDVYVPEPLYIRKSDAELSWGVPK